MLLMKPLSFLGTITLVHTIILLSSWNESEAIMSTSSNNGILRMQRLGAGPMPTRDPFLFCVYHKDEYPAGNEDMEAPWPGNGQDFNPDAPYRMYHGDNVPGFPQHPHRGTCVCGRSNIILLVLIFVPELTETLTDDVSRHIFRI